MEHLVVAILGWIEESVRPRIRDVVPDIDRLEDAPAAYLSERDGVHIGPRRYPVVAVLCAIPFAAAGAFGGYCLNADWVVSGAAVGAVLGPLVVYRFNRGGELHLVPSGVVFSYGAKDVICPWGVFCPWQDATKTDQTWWKVPVFPNELHRLTLLVRGEVKQTGREVRTTHVWVDKPNVFRRMFGRSPASPPDAVSVRDCYAARPNELYPLILAIAPRLAAAEPAAAAEDAVAPES